MNRKEAYVKVLEDSAHSWHELYLKEKEKRKQVEAKYERLTGKIKENAIKEVNEREVRYEEGKVYPAVDFGAGLIPVQHKMKKEQYTLTNHNSGDREEFWDSFKQLVKDTPDEEWDDTRIDVIGQNGNDGLHYDEIPGIPEMYEQMEKEVEDLKNKLEKSQNLANYYKRLAEFNDDEGM